MWKPIAIIALVAQVSLALPSYVIQLNKNATFEDYLQDSISHNSIVKPNSNNTIVIGDFKAFISSFEEDLVDLLKNNSLVSNVFPNETLYLDKNPDTQKLKRRSKSILENPLNKVVSTFAKRDDGVTVQSNAPRHLARLSSREGIYSLSSSELEYRYDATGKNVTAYVLDSGISIWLPDFEGRATRGPSFSLMGIEGDFYGHGTNVAGILGSKTYGVAKDVEIIDVKVAGLIDGGTVEYVLKGIEWANNDRKKKGAKAVANLSLGTDRADAINEAVNAAFDDGLVIVVGAGNGDIDSRNVSPASASNAITVGAIDDRSDTIAIFSNWGPKIDVFAPGYAVESWKNLILGLSTSWYGTSQATPIVAGLAAILLEKGYTKDEIKQEIIKLSTKNAISQMNYEHNSNYTTTPNRVVYNGIVGDSSEYISNPSTAEQDYSLMEFIE